jgi:hypothetical protein
MVRSLTRVDVTLRGVERYPSDEERDVLPEQTRDDTDEGWGERADANSNDERLLEDRPPHWDEET